MYIFYFIDLFHFTVSMVSILFSYISTFPDSPINLIRFILILIYFANLPF